MNNAVKLKTTRIAQSGGNVGCMRCVWCEIEVIVCLRSVYLALDWRIFLTDPHIRECRFLRSAESFGRRGHFQVL